MSFEEKSVWVQLIGMAVVLGSYLVLAARMISNGVSALPAFVPLFAVTIVLMIAVLAAGHIVIAIASRPEGRDERDRLISWRAEGNSSWLLGAGVILAITGLVWSIDNVWIAHFLLLSMFISELARYILQLVYYRRGL